MYIENISPIDLLDLGVNISLKLSVVEILELGKFFQKIMFLEQLSLPAYKGIGNLIKR